MAAIQLDKSLWPVVVVTYPEHYSPEELQVHFAELRPLIHGGRRYVMVQDMRLSGMGGDGATRKLAAEFMTETNTATAKVTEHTVLVASSKIMKLALQGIFALSKPAWPYAVVDSLEEGLRLAREKAARLPRS